MKCINNGKKASSTGGLTVTIPAGASGRLERN